MSKPKSVALVTLGCARNDVDSEELAGRLAADGWQLVDDVATADVALVNTCGFIESNIRKVADGLNPIPVWGDGTEVRDLLHVEDMADGFIFVAENNDTYNIFNVCYGEGFTVNETLATIKELDNNTNPIEYVNNKAPMIPVRLLSSKKINDLGWKPKRNLKEALKETIEWYKANKHLYNPNSKP